MHIRLLIVLAAALTLTRAAVLPAQQRRQIAPGDRVRLSIPSAGPSKYTGVLVAISADSLVVGLGSSGQNSRMSVPRGAVASLEVSRGGAGRAEGPAALLGAVLGGVAAVAGGNAIGWFTDDPPCSGMFDYLCLRTTARDKRALVGFVGVGIGAVTGWLIGRQVDTERWEGVAPMDPLNVTVVRLSGARLGLRASISF